MISLPDSVKQQLMDAPFAKVAELWKVLEDQLGSDAKRWLAQNDRYYLLVRILKRVDLIHHWSYERCREVQRYPDGYIDLWAREHGKSSIITFGGAVQEILNNPEITIGIFSHTKPIAKAFLKQVQNEFEGNEELRNLFSDVLYANPGKESPSWSLDGGITVRRKGNPKENTLEAHGVVDGQPTSKHFQLLIYDDIVTLESVSTPEQISKTTQAWQLSDNLGVAGGRKWIIGTRYSYADTYETILRSKSATPRLYPATDTGKIDGNPVLFTKEIWAQKVRDQGESIIACQMLQDPLAGTQRMFNVEDLQVYEIRPETLNIYIMIDPARSNKPGSADTAMAVIGVDYALNKYLLDGFCHKMQLQERWQKMAMLYHKWKRSPGVRNVYLGYETFGAQADTDYFEEQMRRPDQGGHFPILELAWPRDGRGSKDDRVQRLTPDIRQHKLYVPYDTDEKNLTANQRKVQTGGQGYRVARPIKRLDNEGNVYDVTKIFKVQVHFFPHGGKVDLIDSVSRIYDLDPHAPSFKEGSYHEPDYI